MNRLKYILLLTLFLTGLLSTISCSRKEEETLHPQISDEVLLNFTAKLNVGISAKSRAIINTGENNKFPSGRYSFGTWICKHEDNPANFEIAKEGYCNFQAIMAVGKDLTQTWSYNFSGRDSHTLNVSRQTPVDIYSVYPRPDGNPNPDEVPFTSGQTDWLWAKETILEESMASNQATAHLDFSHAMTCIQLNIKSMYPGSNLTSISLEDKKGRLYEKGLMNLAARSLILSDNDKAKENILTITANAELTTAYKSFYIIMPPVSEYENEDFTLSFVFNNNQAKSVFKIPNKMNDNVTINSFETGKRYIYQLTLDNHTIFSPAGVDDTWETKEYELIL